MLAFHNLSSGLLWLYVISLLTLSVPHFFWLWQKWVYQSVPPYWSNPPFQFFDIGALWLGGLDQYGPEHFEV